MHSRGLTRFLAVSTPVIASVANPFLDGVYIIKK